MLILVCFFFIIKTKKFSSCCYSQNISWHKFSSSYSYFIILSWSLKNNFIFQFLKYMKDVSTNLHWTYNLFFNKLVFSWCLLVLIQLCQVDGSSHNFFFLFSSLSYNWHCFREKCQQLKPSNWTKCAGIFFFLFSKA